MSEEQGILTVNLIDASPVPSPPTSGGVAAAGLIALASERNSTSVGVVPWMKRCY
jgi:hypothetical protein